MTTQRPHSSASAADRGSTNGALPNGGSASPRITESEKAKDTTGITPTYTDSDEQCSEVSGDGVFHQTIVKDGKEVLVSWTLEEESRVVRKADFLFLPIFAVRTSTNRHSGTAAFCYPIVANCQALADVYVDGY